MARERLDKVLAARGIGSRKAVGGQIRAGQVTVNGTVCRDPAAKADPHTDLICLSGAPIRVRRERYLMLNKPADVISATQDTEHKTVLDLLPQSQRGKLAPIGRLDKDTEGLLLLTDDGALNHALTSPRHHVDKRYFARVSGKLEEDSVERFHNGMVLADGTRCLPAELIILGQDHSNGWTSIEVVLREGKYHQVKRMVAAVGGHVEFLKRLSMGPLMLDEGLAPGQYRDLTEQEIQILLQSVRSDA